MAPKVLVSDKLSETAVQIFRDRGIDVEPLPLREVLGPAARRWRQRDRRRRWSLSFKPDVLGGTGNRGEHACGDAGLTKDGHGDPHWPKCYSLGARRKPLKGGHVKWDAPRRGASDARAKGPTGLPGSGQAWAAASGGSPCREPRSRSLPHQQARQTWREPSAAR